MYESKISNARWMAYDLPGNIGWIAYIVCLALSLRRGPTWFSAAGILPAALMLTGVAELIDERIRKLDRVLPRRRLFRGFGALTLGGVLGVAISLSGVLWAKDAALAGWMLAGAALCALFAGLILREYRRQE